MAEQEPRCLEQGGPTLRRGDMHLHGCPECGFLFIPRKAGRCPKCKVQIVHAGDYYTQDIGERVYVCDKKTETITLLPLRRTDG